MARWTSRLCYSAAAAAAVGLLLGSVAALGLAAAETMPRLIAEGERLRAFEGLVLYGAFAWTLLAAAVAVVAEVGAEIREWRCGQPSSPDYPGFYRCEAHSELLVLVPSFREEAETVWQTLMSAALAEHPNRRVVLLIDDPDPPATADQAKLLADARAQPVRLQALFDQAAAPFAEARARFASRRAEPLDLVEELRTLSRLYGEAAEWLDREVSAFRCRRADETTHTDELFAARILQEPAAELRRRASALVETCGSVEAIALEYDRLAALFRVRLSSFERKRYANLSHAPNKAMNLNRYLSLIGGAFREERSDRGVVLLPCPPGEATLVVPDYRFVVMIDADSLITHDYNVRLLKVMNAPGGERIAVAQSPYTAIPGAPHAIERAAAASTDGQYFSHQGLAHLGAASWVGASALVRVAALRDIATTRIEGGREINIFIKDDILIEDAAATIDLLHEGWRIHHDRRRLSYSATPPDFGALIIQRRRWANGGLLLLPRLFRVAWRRPLSARRIANALVRAPNLTSAATNGVYLSLFLFIPFDDSVVPPWLALILAPSLLVTVLGLLRAGYRLRDMFAVQALSMLLAPVNLAGTIQSLRQAVVGRPIPFARTPKVGGRTAAPKLYIFAIYGVVVYSAGLSVVDAHFGRDTHAAFAAVNAIFFLYCLVRYVGLRPSLEDAGFGVRFRRRAKMGRLGSPLSRLFQREVDCLAEQMGGVVQQAGGAARLETSDP